MPRALWFAAAAGWLRLALACGAGLLGLSLAMTPAPARAQDGPASGPRSEAHRDDGETSSSSSSPADGANPPRVDARESFLSWMARASGPIGLVILAMSFYLIALVVWMALRYRTSVAIPRTLAREIDALLEDRKYSEAYHRADASESFLGRVLAAGVRKLPAGIIPAHRAMEMANEDATMEMEHRTTYLATVGTLGPMIGLVGTVYGMILSFRVIATEGSSPQASQLAAGISTALFATLEGIAISIPAIYFYSMFRNRISRLSLEVAMAAEPLLERFAPGIRPQDAAPAQAPAQPAVTVPVPMPGPSSHPHPYAASAALAAAAGAGHPRTALPPASSEES
ncbi:MotA/TolQ/ExbB proton channel family protein [Aquisphaera insulae]|uniref:MotA/TolQ/ExbB proton channel family protein n=1 Tax=Aquisphaera insulae TaxID=2712864 RepID=UPI00202DBAEF|nr:MotA/TolQ/ExbB proton channel family protein [Aquisphaera insulae]